MKDGKRTNLRTINLYYRRRALNPRARPTEIQIAFVESRAEMSAFASEIDQVLEEGASSSRLEAPNACWQIASCRASS